MRHLYTVLVPLLAAAVVPAPAPAQVSATIHIGPIRIGDRPAVHRVPRYVVVGDYPARNYGQWKRTVRNWRPVTLYVLNGRYYERPYRDARPIVVYHYRDSYFRAPRDRDWNDYRTRYERGEWRRDIRVERRVDRRVERRVDRRVERRGNRQIERRVNRPAVRARGRG